MRLSKHDEPPIPSVRHSDSQFSSRNSIRRIAFSSSFTPRSTRSQISTKTLSNNRTFCIQCRRSEYVEPQRFNPSKPSVGRTAGKDGAGVGEGGDFPTRVFVGHSIYKGKAVLTVEPRGPEFAPLESGAFKIAKDGFVILNFAPKSRLRQYDWS